jgi:cell division protein FtsN
MAYQFAFDGKSLWALGGGSVALCLLIFFAGVLLGANWGAREAAATTARGAPASAHGRAQPAHGAQGADATAAEGSAAALPYEPPPARGPAFYDPQGPQDLAAQGYAPRGVGAQGYGAQDYGAGAYAEQDYGARPVAPPAYGARQPRYADPAAAAREAAPPLDLRREAARLSAPGADAEPRVVSEADSEAADAPFAAAPNYSVQVGAFADEAEARRLLSELENKGYTPAIYGGRDGGGRTWYTVRIGAYSTQHEAARAAQNFTRQERLQATARPSNSL